MLFLRLTHGDALDRLQNESGQVGVKICALTRRLGRLSWAALGVGLAACASISVDSSPEAKQKLVAERAQARWELLLKGDVEGAYQYLSAGSKAGTPLALYKAKIKPGLWRKAKVDKVDCEAEVCKVWTLLTYDYKTMKGIETPFPETWIIENGTVWYVYR
ncbi:MAG TPA: hypothetical protein VMM27_08080 [Casimicrobiaceae bacterium]|nr:hypothetical protein [Casimicrobiaceae bacterium]